MAAAVPMVLGASLVGPVASAGAVSNDVAASDAGVPVGGPLSNQAVSALSTGATQRVIVELRAQPTVGTDRAHLAQHAAQVGVSQAPVLSELHQLHAPKITPYHLIPALAATVSKAEEARLAADPAVATVIPDEPVRLAAPAADTTSAAGGSSTTSAGGTMACGANGTPTQDEYLSTMRVGSSPSDPGTARSLGYDGTGVTVAYIADGADPTNPDFQRNGKSVFTDVQDFSGVGTTGPNSNGEAFIDSSAIAAQGTQTYDISKYSAVRSPGPCTVKVQGVAPGANLVALDAFGPANINYNSAILDAIDYATYVDHVQVLNESFGQNPFPDQPTADIVARADDAATAAGVTVVTSSGDSGETNTIGTPATDPNMISVGASTTFQLYDQIGYGGANLPGVKGWASDNISALSSGGVSQAGRTVDVVAPGDLNWSLCDTRTTRFQDCYDLNGNPTPVLDGGGTSQAAPLTAGVAALVIQAYEKGHRGSAPTPAVTKQIITSTARDLGAPGDQQGAGEVDAYRAVLAAASYPAPATAPAGGQVLESINQLDAAAPAGTSQTLTETLTNSGPSKVTVQASSRTLGAPQTLASGSVTFTSSSPTLPDYVGDPFHYAFYSLNVPSGTGVLRADIAYPGPTIGKISLIDPTGKLAAYALPQGAGTHSEAAVDSPVAGKWTMVVWSRTPARGGTVGPIAYRVQATPYVSLGVVSPTTVTLKAGQSAPVTVTATTPATPGDLAGSLVLSSSNATSAAGTSTGGTSTVPVILRALAPTPAPTSTFSGTLVGGNGRFNLPPTGQGNFYQFDLPAGQRELTAQVTLGGSPVPTFNAELIDPVTGVADAVASNTLVGNTVSGVPSAVQQPGASLHVEAPSAGRWTLAINFYTQTAGTSITEPFRVRLTTRSAPSSASGLPDSVSSTLLAGRASVAYVTVKNTGTAAEQLFVDPRLSSTVALPLASFTSSSTPLPVTDPTLFPEYLVPSHTSSVSSTASSTIPITYDFGSFYGDPDVGAVSPAFSGNASASYTPANGIAPDGMWFIEPAQATASGKGPIAPVTVQTTATAQTAAFDPAVTSPTGDLWAASADPSAPFNPYTVNPGQTATIPVSITPSGPSGTTVTGTLYVASATDGFATAYNNSGISPMATDVASFPYAYTIK